jgi:peptidoglycan/xylan/chitin deacetylase (PgdA/CDA1 family)
MKQSIGYMLVIMLVVAALVGGYFLNRQIIDQRFDLAIGRFQAVTNNTINIAAKVVANNTNDAAASDSSQNLNPSPASAGAPANTSGGIVYSGIAKFIGPTIANADQTSILPKGSIPVLMYHYIGDLPANADATRKGLTVSTQNFEDQVNFLATQGYSSITLDQLYAYLTKGQPIPDKSVVFSFDDGYADTFENAVPILEAHHMTGVFGIITGFAGTNSNYATWQQIITAQKQDMVIVSHSYSHPDFASKDQVYQDYNIAKSTVDLTQELGSPPSYFIYPYGKYNSTTEQVLKDHGYVMSFTTSYGFVRRGQNLLELPRVRVHGAETLSTFICEIYDNCIKQSAAIPRDLNTNIGE